MADFEKAAATAKRLIEANGREVAFLKRNRTAADPSKPWRGPTEPIAEADGGGVVPAVCAFVPASGSGLGRLVNDGRGAVATAYEQVGLVAEDSLPAGTDLEPFGFLRDGDTVWRIVSKARLQPASRSILYALALAR